MKKEIELIFEKLETLNKKSEMEQIPIDFELAKELICTAIENDLYISKLQKSYLKSIVTNIRYAVLYKSDYVTIIGYICNAVEVHIHSCPLEKKFAEINTTKSINIIKRISRVLTGRSYILDYYDYDDTPTFNEVINLEWCDD